MLFSREIIESILRNNQPKKENIGVINGNNYNGVINGNN